MHFAFQDKDNLYIVMDYLSGGDLRYHICQNKKKFSEHQTSINNLHRIFHSMSNTVS